MSNSNSNNSGNNGSNNTSGVNSGTKTNDHVTAIGNADIWREGVNAAVCETPLPARLGAFVRRLQGSATAELLGALDWRLAFRVLHVFVACRASAAQLLRSDCVHDVLCGCAEPCRADTRATRTELISLANVVVAREMGRSLVAYLHRRDTMRAMLRAWAGFASWSPDECVALLLLFVAFVFRIPPLFSLWCFTLLCCCRCCRCCCRCCRHTRCCSCCCIRTGS